MNSDVIAWLIGKVVHNWNLQLWPRFTCYVFLYMYSLLPGAAVGLLVYVQLNVCVLFCKWGPSLYLNPGWFLNLWCPSLGMKLCSRFYLYSMILLLGTYQALFIDLAYCVSGEKKYRKLFGFSLKEKVEMTFRLLP